jgi:hypothetical protein
MHHTTRLELAVAGARLRVIAKAREFTSSRHSQFAVLQATSAAATAAAATIRPYVKTRADGKRLPSVRYIAE